MSRIDLVSKNLLANYFRKSNKDFPWLLLFQIKSITNIAKIESNKCNKIQGLEREEIKEGPEMSTRFTTLEKKPRKILVTFAKIIC